MQDCAQLNNKITERKSRTHLLGNDHTKNNYRNYTKKNYCVVISSSVLDSWPVQNEKDIVDNKVALPQPKQVSDKIKCVVHQGQAK